MKIGKIKEYIFYTAIFLTLMPVLSPFSFNFSFGDMLLILLFITIFFNKNGIVLNIFRSTKVTTIYYFSVLIFFLGFGISTVINGGATNFFLIFFQYFVLLVVLPMLFANIQYDFKKLLKSIITSMIITILFGFYIYFFTSSIDFSIGGRMGSLFKNPNILAKNIALIIPIILLYIYTFKTKKGFIALLCMLAGLLIASSFGGLISSALSFSLFYLFSFKIKKMLKVVSILLISVLTYIVLFGLPRIFVERIIPVVTSGNFQNAGSFNEKIMLMYEAVTLISSNPFLGLGAGRYIYFNINAFTVHNSYLLVWAEGGVLAILGLIGILLAFSLKVFENIKDTYMFAAGLAILCALTFNLFTDVHFYNRYTFLSIYSVTLVARAYDLKKENLIRDKNSI